MRYGASDLNPTTLHDASTAGTGSAGMTRSLLLSWSSGKDSAWALHVLRADPSVEIRGLFTTVNEGHDRVAMHAVRRSLLEKQAAAAGLPLAIITIPDRCSNETYQRVMGDFVAGAMAEGVDAMAFGDLFLADVRAYRERMLDGTGITSLFPLWRTDTARLSRDMIDGGLRARVTCVDRRRLDPTFAGRAFDHSFLDQLPHDVDPCGENGEFHTFVTAGPMFERALDVTVGEIVTRDGFVFADLLPPS